MISIHAPRMGSDGHAVPCAFQSPEISIHAPRMGSDPAPSRPAPTPRYFNPRSPDGERPFSGPHYDDHAGISIHAPRMGSDQGHAASEPHRQISIHAPRMGSDPPTPESSPVPFRFQSTLPGWGATVFGGWNDVTVTVFQSTLPGWGATYSNVFGGVHA